MIIGCAETPFYSINGKINLFKEVLKTSSCLGLIESLSENWSLSNADTEDFLTV